MKKLLIVLFVGIWLLAPWIGAIGDEQKPAASGSTFVIGLSPERNIFRQVERYTPLTDYLSAKCGLDVKPETTFALRRGLVPSVRTSIGDALLTMHDDPKGREVLKAFGARRFVVASNEEYQPVIAYARQLGINLEKYDFPREQ